ncbi:MAG: FGGY-family carbohydrate kinase [Acidobacteriota bacterium]
MCPDRTAVIGIDVGTSGVRTLLADPAGKVLAQTECSLSTYRLAAAGIHEQDPRDWWLAICDAVPAALKQAGQFGISKIAGITVTSTSGSLVLADRAGAPVRAAILYDDNRAGPICEGTGMWLGSTGHQLNASFSLAKALWVRDQEPEVWERAQRLLHPADWIMGKLTGEFGLADSSNALKLGFDQEARQWDSAVLSSGIPMDRMPSILSPGEPAGLVCTTAATETGLNRGVPVFAGATDGVASLLASGASLPGEANTTLGTTTVWKVLTERRPRATRQVYCHRHPLGLWAPGAASNSGPGCLHWPSLAIDPAEVDRQAAGFLPSSVVCYLLAGVGERFPFSNGRAQGFVEGNPEGPAQWHAAQLQSLAFLERWGYEVLEGAGIFVGDQVFSTGGAAKSDVLSRLRSTVLRRNVTRVRYPAAAFGACILAASGGFFGGSVKTAVQDMTVVCSTAAPAPDEVDSYDELYLRFRQACAQRGYA